jgi:hypothetical protein
MRQQFRVLKNVVKRSGRLQDVALFDEVGNLLDVGLPPILRDRIGVDGSKWVISQRDLSIDDSDAYWGAGWAVKFFRWAPSNHGYAVIPTLAIPEGATGFNISAWKGTQEGIDYPSLHTTENSWSFEDEGSGAAPGPILLYGKPGFTYTIALQVRAATPENLLGIEIDTLPIARAFFPNNPIIGRVLAQVHTSGGGPLTSIPGVIPTEQLVDIDLGAYGGGFAASFHVPTQDILAPGGHVGPHLENAGLANTGVIVSVVNPNFTVIKNDGSAGFVAAANGEFDLVDIFSTYNVEVIDWASAARVGTDLSYEAGNHRVISAAGGAVQALFFGRLKARFA